MKSKYKTNPERVPSNIERPSFRPAIATPGVYYTAIYYGNSGWKLYPDHGQLKTMSFPSLDLSFLVVTAISWPM